jgi:hypothetical protein
MKEIVEKNLPLPLRSRPWGVSASKIDVIVPCSSSGCSNPLQRSPAAPSPSASPRRDRDLAFGVPGSELYSCGATIRLSVGSRCWHSASRLLSLDPLPVGKLRSRVVLYGLENLPYAGDLLTPASSPMSPRRAGTVPWVLWRPPYAIMTSAYNTRRQVAFEAAPPAAF